MMNNRIIIFSRKLRRPILILLGLLFIVGIQAADFMTGQEIIFSLFYLLGAAYFGWFVGWQAGIIAAVVLGILPLVTDIISGATYSHLAVPIWMVCMRIAIFSFVVYILCRLQRRENELKTMVNKLRHSNDELEQFTSIASHDLKEPLHTIEIFCQLLERPAGNEKQEYLRHMKESINRMRLLITDLLSYARVIKAASPKEKTDLKRVIDELLKDLQALIKEKEARVEIHELPTLEIIPLQMRQLFQNLISNALKYGRKDEPPLVTIYSQTTAQWIEVYVQDNGIGFDEKNMEKVFSPFQRLNQHIEGTGLGLPICKKIVEQHGGEIIAHSMPGNGSVFIIRFPRILLVSQTKSINIK